MRPEPPPGLWKPSFLLLWQGQLVSSLGDAAYRVALGFWVLDVTRSTALLGTVLAVPVVTRMAISPWAGALADRADRRSLLVLSDFAAAVVVTLVGLAALSDELRVWMVVVASMLVGAAGSVLHPTVEALLPELVSQRDLSRANAAMAAGSTGAAVIGNSVGGVLFGWLGAPILFLGNGLSFALSAVSELFLRLPPPPLRVAPRPGGSQQREGDEPSVAARATSSTHDPPPDAVPPSQLPARDGAPLGLALRMLWAERGVRALWIVTGVTHLGSSAAMVMLVAHFHSAAGLGPSVYGFAMASVAAGAFVGYSLATASQIPATLRPRLFVSLGLLEAGCFALLPWLDSRLAILTLSAGIGLSMAVGSTLVTTGLQLAVAESMRGRAFGLRASWMLALTAAATLGAGGVAEWVAPRVVISLAAGVMSLGFSYALLSPSLRRTLRTSAGAHDAPS